MRIGLFFDPPASIDAFVDDLTAAEQRGFHSAWVSQIFSWDALTLLAVAGARVPRIELGTGVVPTYPRHPLMLAGQALTTQAAAGGRLTLGIGLSHQIVIETVFGESFEKPARHMREYLSILMPALRGEQVNFQGETIKAQTLQKIEVEGSTTPRVLVAALAPRMLELAGTLTDGTITWMAGPGTVRSHIAPSINEAAKKAG